MCNRLNEGSKLKNSEKKSVKKGGAITNGVFVDRTLLDGDPEEGVVGDFYTTTNANTLTNDHT